MGQQDQPHEKSARNLGSATGETATVAGGKQGRRGGRGGRGSRVLRSEDGPTTPTAAKKSVLPAHDSPAPKAVKAPLHDEDDPFDGGVNEDSAGGHRADNEESEMDVPTEPYDDDDDDDKHGDAPSSAFPAVASTASAAELAADAAHQAHEQEQKQQAEAKAKQEANRKKEAKERSQALLRPKAQAPPPKAQAPPQASPPKAKAPAPGAKAKAEAPPPKAMPTTFAGRHPPANAMAAERFRSEQKQWYTIRNMWDHEGLMDAMNQNESQRSFYEIMRRHVHLTDEDYHCKASAVWQMWKRDHPVKNKS